MKMKFHLLPAILGVLVLSLLTAGILPAAVSAAPSANAVRFDLSDPAWKLNTGEGRRLESADGVSGAVLEVTGTGGMTNAWELGEVPLLPGRIAMFRFKVRRTAGSGGGMTGFDFANFDITVSKEWKTVPLIFIVPDRETGKIRLGQWHISGTLQFAEPELIYVTPTFGEEGIGEDECIEYGDAGKIYSFQSQWGKSQGNFSRTFVKSTVGFNSNRWCFGGGEMTYRFDAADLKKASAMENPAFFGSKLSFSIGYHRSGGLTAQCSKDGETWTDLDSLSQMGTREIKLPAAFDGAKTIWVRFKPLGQTECQIYSFSFHAPLTAETAQALKAAEASKENTPIGTAKPAERGTTLFWELVKGSEGFEGVLPHESELPKAVPGNQVFEKTVTWTDAAGQKRSADVRCSYYVADFYREDFGKLLDSASPLSLWWCESTWKVNQTRRVPTEKETVGLQMSAARHDYESCQLVLSPKEAAELVGLSFAPLKKADGTEIPAENLTVRDVFFHFIDHPTDFSAVREAYPDALPPLALPKKLEGRKNAPLWITVYVPEGTPAGDYETKIELKYRTSSLTSEPAQVSVPLKLRVWNFDIPKTNHSETAYGYSGGTSARYHGAKTYEDRQKIDEIYLRFLAKYRITPYDPTGDARISYKFVVDKENPEKSHCIVDFTRFDVAMEKAVRENHVTGFSLRLAGMGGGTFHARYEPSIQGFGEETVEYQAMFASMVRQIEAHLREKGWLKMAYIYWFDEPDVKDYEFVRNGMNRIKKYAPGLQTMLTEEPSKEVIEKSLLGKVDIWCPVTPNYDEENAKLCKAKGERFWWYVCCWPHAPYCTEFIDHSAVELRTWLWQSWKYDVVGTLIWTTNYWTSSAAYPDQAQNPYLDPMSYVSGYDTPVGAKRFWGNGDGRLYYPPLSCAVPNQTDTPNFEEPVSSIRFEMLREGLEDYEMLYLLREKIKAAKNLTPEEREKYEALLTVPEEITSSMTEFSKNPTPIYERRKQIAEAIEAL